jgi:UDP-glucose:glycoprotein glucosyltransferase
MQGARRIVAEWPDLDQEARDFTTRTQKELAFETEPQPLSSAHVEEVLMQSEEQNVERAEIDGTVPSSITDKESAAEL